MREPQNLLDWWLDAMVDGVAAMIDHVAGYRRVRLTPTEGGYLIDVPGSRRDPIGPVSFGGDAAGDANGAPETSIETSIGWHEGRHIDVVLRPDEVLIRVLDPLPWESRPYLGDIVRHHLENLTPWRLADVYYTYFVTPLDSGSGQLMVTVVATARAIHANLLAYLRARRPKSLRLLYVDAAVPTGVVPIATDDIETDRSRRARLKGKVKVAAALASLVMIAGAVLLFAANHRIDAQLDQMTATIAEHRSALAAMGGARGPAVSKEIEAIVARKRAAPVVAVALDALSATLPDDTWLTELRLAEDSVHMTGVSQNVGALIPLLDASRGFADARFFAPTTRLPDGKSDQFHIQVQVLPVHREGK